MVIRKRCNTIYAKKNKHGKTGINYVRDEANKNSLTKCYNQLVSQQHSNIASQTSSSSTSANNVAQEANLGSSIMDPANMLRKSLLVMVKQVIGTDLENEDLKRLINQGKPESTICDKISAEERLLSSISQETFGAVISFDNEKPLVARVEFCEKTFKNLAEAIGVDKEKTIGRSHI